ncbi:MAG: helix-turn-helix transcriptional regulator [Pseudomonadota bacterium]
MNSSAVGIVLSALALGQCLLAASILLSRRDPHGVYWPLCIFFMANVFTELSAVADIVTYTDTGIDRLILLDIVSIAAFLLIAPALWFYVRNVTSQRPAKTGWSETWHLLPFVFASGVCSVLIGQPDAVQQSVIGEGDFTGSPAEAWLATLLLIVAVVWLLQSVLYLCFILRRLLSNRTQLKNHFASTEGRELRWIFVILSLLMVALLLQAADLFLSLDSGAMLFANMSDFALIFIVSLWGLRQAPTFISGGSEPYELQNYTAKTQQPKTESSASVKYERSALDDTHMDRIAGKIVDAMDARHLYLEPDLSLRDLAAAICVTPNYVSQTLNARIGETFFDYVNSYRIRAALQKLCDTDDTILAIAYEVGFNSRSSFYKSFKKNIGVTPTAYRARLEDRSALQSDLGSL